MNDCISLIGREKPLFATDIAVYESEISEKVRVSSFLVIGGAGSIGQAVVKELFKRGPRRLYVVDLSENSMVELVRDLRSSIGYIKGDFRTFTIDCGSHDFDVFIENEGPFDYILNLSALKHVRSERDPYTLMRMVEVNVLNTNRTLWHAVKQATKKYFCVSTDKATNPVNMMGASKRIMELYLMRWSDQIPVSTARFANVAFSDGSLLHGFTQRIAKGQPLSAPNDVRRYFLTPQESGELCLMSFLFGENRDILFPKLAEKLHLITFAEIARRYLANLGYAARECATEDEARATVDESRKSGQWPCFFFASDTTGEKGIEEFTAKDDIVDWDRFASIGVIKNTPVCDDSLLEQFSARIGVMRASGRWSKQELITLFKETVPEFDHTETNRHLDNRM